ncbi:hypothetical protein ABIC27_004979 [Streptomyces sp. PvR034]
MPPGQLLPQPPPPPQDDEDEPQELLEHECEDDEQDEPPCDDDEPLSPAHQLLEPEPEEEDREDFRVPPRDDFRVPPREDFRVPPYASHTKYPTSAAAINAKKARNMVLAPLLYASVPQGAGSPRPACQGDSRGPFRPKHT